MAPPPLPIPALITLGVVVHVLLVLSIFDIHFQVRRRRSEASQDVWPHRTTARRQPLYNGLQRGSGADTDGVEGSVRAHSPADREGGGCSDPSVRPATLQCRPRRHRRGGVFASVSAYRKGRLQSGRTRVDR
jgi:hypothetical protein